MIGTNLFFPTRVAYNYPEDTYSLSGVQLGHRKDTRQDIFRQKRLEARRKLWFLAPSGLLVCAKLWVDGNMNSSSYIYILNSHILPLMQDDQVLQQDNAPCHKSNEVKNFMQEFGVAVVPDRPARSPDLNVIENCWGVLKQRLERHQCATLDDLWEKLRRNFMKFRTVLFKNCLNLFQDE